MRSLLKDAGRMLATISTPMNILGTSTSTSGVFSDGTPFKMIKTGTATYQIRFDRRLIPISGNVNPGLGTCIAVIDLWEPGRVQISISDSAGAPFNNVNFRVTLNCLDTR